MPTREEIVDRLFAGRAELSVERSRKHYTEALKMARAWAQEGGGTEACVLGLEALRELALDAETPSSRASFWKQALQALFWVDNIEPFVQADESACLAVDIFQDRFADLEINERVLLLRSARDRVAEALKASTQNDRSSTLLARKSVILRHLALLESPDASLRRLSEAQRAASRAVELRKTPAVTLEYGLSEWALARYEKSDEQYTRRLRAAEQALRDPILEKFEPAEFALARFYRLTYRALDACEQFLVSANETVNRRRLWRESPIYAEGAIHLSYLHYPAPIISQHLSEGISLLETALAAGHRNARIVVDLSFLRAIQGDADAGVTALADLRSERGEMSWQGVLDLIAHGADSDLPTLGFALGIDTSAVLTRLGTFANRFLADQTLAEALYRAAIRSDPHDPIAHTNLARFLVQSGHSSGRREARRLLQTAQNFSDRRFRWWRVVLAELDALDRVDEPSKSIKTDRKAAVPQTSTRSLTDLKQIRQRYRQVANLEDRQRRGYELEELIYALANVTFGTAGPSYRFSRPLVEKTHQFRRFHRASWRKVPLRVQMAGEVDRIR